MKKFLLVSGLILCGTLANATGVLNLDTFSQDEITLVSDINSTNFWKKKGISQEKVLSVGQKILIDNKINKRVPLFVPSKKTVNAYANLYDKSVNVYEGILAYIDNDDELAYILSHEIAHAVESYGGIVKYMAMSANSKKYEEKADIIALDYMVKSGYNPVAAITMGNKIFGEPIYDWGFTYTHPKGSKRLIGMYKHIYVKYPQYLNSSLTQTASFKNFEYAMSKEINSFQQKQRKRQLKQQQDEL